MEALADLDAAGLLGAASSAVEARRLAEIEDLCVLAQWAAVHSTDPTQGPDGAQARRIGNVLVEVGGEGTPGVQDFCLGEIAMARGTGVMATRNALADVLDLMYRLPRVWQVCRAGEAEVWIARRVAKLSRHLDPCQVGVVDAAVARVIGTEAAGRVLSVAEAKIIEADRVGHRRRVEEERRRRYVSLSRSDEAGLRTVIARVTAGDAAWVDATLTRVADILTTQHPDKGRDELRSIAFGYLARPAELLTLLLEHTDDDTGSDADETRPEDEDEGEATEATGPEHEDHGGGADAGEEARRVRCEGLQGPSHETPDTDVPEPPASQESGLHRALAFPADLLEALRCADFTAWAPRCTFYVHLSEAALHGAPGVARVEGLGPIALQHLAELVGRADLVVKPVLDLSDRVRTTAYEHPESLKERTHLVTGGDYWPYAVSTSRAVDYDHPTPYRDPGQGGPPAAHPQTGTHNSGPLGRRHHRWKTHAGYRARQCGQGRYAWLTPHGLGFVVDHRGTRPIHPHHARAIIDAPPGIDLYPTDYAVDWGLTDNGP